LKNLPVNILNLYLIKIAKWFNLVMPVVVLFYQDNGMGMQQIFILKSIYSIGIVVMEIPSGYMADVWGHRKILIIGTILGALGFIIYSFSHSFLYFAIAEVVLGIGFSCVSGADSALLYDSLKYDKKEGEYIKYEGIITSIGNFAEAFAGILAGLIAAISFRAPFYFQAMIACIGIPAAFLLKERRIVTEVAVASISDIVNTIRESLKNKELRSAIMVSSFTGSATLIFAWFVQPFFKEAGLPVSLFGLLWTLLNLSVGMVSIVSYRIERFLGQRRTLLFIIISTALFFVLSAFNISLAGIAFLFLFYATRGVATPVLKDYINGYTDSKVRATVLSLRSFEIRIIFAIVGPILGYLTDHFSLKTALLTMGITYFIATMLGSIHLLRAKK